MTQSSCKRDTKSESHVGMKLALVRVFSCKHPLTNFNSLKLIPLFKDLFRQLISRVQHLIYLGPVYMEVGGPQVGEETCSGTPHLSCKRDKIKMRDYMDRRVTSATWGPPPPCKQALKVRPFSQRN